MEEENVTVGFLDLLEMLNISLTLKNFSNVSTRSNDPAAVAAVDFWFALVIFPVLACLGILGNLFSIVVWHTDRKSNRDRKFNATTFLFKSVAAWDIAFLGLATGLNFILRDRRLSTEKALLLSLYHGASFAQMVSVHITLLLAHSRWLVAVFVTGGPLLLTRKLIYSMSGFIVTYCAGLQAVQAVYNWYYPKRLALFVPKELFGLVLPLVCFLVFNVGLIRVLRRPLPAELRNSTYGGAAQQNSRRQTAKAVVLMSVFSFVAYLIGTLVKMHSIKNYYTVPDVVISQLASLCQVVNCSVNVFIFLVFLRPFRNLAKACCKRPCQRGRSDRPATRMEMTPLPTRQGPEPS